MLKPTLSAAEVSALQKKIDQAKNIVIICHKSPDGDALGSSLALWEWLRTKDKNVTVIVPNLFPDFLRWMNGADKVLIYDVKNENHRENRERGNMLIAAADLIFSLDHQSLPRTNPLDYPRRRFRGDSVMIDHHENPDPNYCKMVISRPKMSSTCELLYRIFEQLGVADSLPLHACEDIYAGMCTDTGRFSYSSNDPEIFLIIAALLKRGVNKDLIIRNLFNQNTEGRYRLMGYAFSQKLVVRHDLHASYFSLTREELKNFHYKKGDAEGIVNMPLEIAGQKLSISLRDDTDAPDVCVSLRCFDEVRGDLICNRYFHGGGHISAAGGRLAGREMPYAVARVEAVLELLRPYLLGETPWPETAEGLPELPEEPLAAPQGEPKAAEGGTKAAE